MPASPRALPFDFLINLVCVAISALVFFYVPEGIDAKKPANSDSFWNLYLSGSLDHVPHITQLLVASAIANFFDMFVIYYHLTNPPHPKFVMIRPRRISIFLHLTSGIVEISSATAIIFVGNPDIHLILVRIMTAAAFVHASTAYYQTGLVFGAKGIMVPGYLYAITVHALNAYRLLYNPTSLVYVFKTFLTLSIYVWCRVFIFFFRALNMFTGYNYTISITLSGALLFPFALGPIGNYAFMGVVAVYNILHALVWSQEEDFAGFMFIEHERYTMVDANLFAEWKKKLSKTKSPNEIDRERAEVAFKSADTNNSKTLTIDEVQEMMKPLKLREQVKQSIEKAVRENSKAKKGVDFDTFYRSVWNILNVHGRLEELPKNIGKLEPRKQAKAVFDRLDMDKSGQIDKTEIDFLLQVWGLPKTETDAYFAAYGIKGNKFDFEVFYKKMTPIWQFAVHEVSYDTQAPRVGAKTHMNKAE